MDQIWWNHIIKAHAFLENIVKEAAGGHSLLLTLPDSVPWKSTFLDLIREQLLMENPKNKLEVIECPEEEPGEFILQKYCKRETRAKYRYGVSYAQFLGKCQETVLNDRYVWVSDIPDEKVTKWLDFVSEYQKNVQDKTPGIFILEVHNAKRESGVLALSRISEHMINMLSAHWHHLRQTVKSFCVRIWQRPLLLSAGMMWNYVRYVWRREWSS